MRDYDVDERPIPLGRGRVREAAAEAPPAAHIEEDANVEVARPAAVVAEAASQLVADVRLPEPTSGPTVTVLLEGSAPPAASMRTALTAEELAAAEAHPLVAVRRLRFEVEVVGPVHGGRLTGLGRLLVVYALVMALVLALILAFAVLVAHAGRTPA